MTKKELKLLREEMSSWKPAMPTYYKAGDIFEIYHDIILLYMSQMHKEVVEYYWNSFFRNHEIPECSIKDEIVEIYYISNSNKILNRVKEKLTDRLNKID